ncbi:Ig-like domain-containing protein [Pinibacter aurantiacus]|uniref:T9SS type A sorting domain-containing protein n=1 Tax=Pinibacter aurantiacus TaxID=2851599 RepID=A0A9E2SA23_9BACT|nr:T9SS type A sorting domain-containing protein [Pinibacter aurantiacus]MBV4357459.1 T9SS type A sorting domain-containing protein [Pinibacter aurantiacus]
MALSFFGRRVLLCCMTLIVYLSVNAQFPYVETFKNNTAAGVILQGNKPAYLTSGIIDPPGEGCLRLTSNDNYQSGVAFCSVSFPSNNGLVVEFEYFMHDGEWVGDGICFFLYDATVATPDFHPGAFGGSLGYAQLTDIPGVPKGYIGIGFDAYGNFSKGFQGRIGGTTVGERDTNAVTVRGPGIGALDRSTNLTDYPWIATQKTTDLTPRFLIIDSTPGRATEPTSVGYRKARIEMQPVVDGSDIVTGYLLTVKITVGGAVPTEYTILKNIAYNYAPPPTLKFGFTGSTGGATNIQEIRNLYMDVYSPLDAPTAVADNYSTCTGVSKYFDPLSNDFTPNGGGQAPYPAGVNLNKASIDLDVTTPGIQQTKSIPGKGVFTTDASGLVNFTPDAAFISGTVTNDYFVNDIYGETSTAGTITVTVNNLPAELLTVNSPQTNCEPATIDITSNPAVWYTTGNNGTVTYYEDALATRPITSPQSIGQSGTYYIQLTSNISGCSVIKPVDVTITSAAAPPTATAGFNCGPGKVSLTASGAASGEDYKWYDASSGGNTVQVNGSSYLTPDISSSTNYWVTKYNVKTGGCESARVPVMANINANPIAPANAGRDQLGLTDISTLSLNGSTPASGETGLWSFVKGPNLPTIVSPENYNATVQSIVPGNYVFRWTIQRGTCTSTDDVVIDVKTTSRVLPIVLKDFSVQLQNQTAKLSWTTTQENNSKGFEIQRSTNGTDFSTISFVPGTNSQQLHSYHYNDDITNISSAYVAYRLKQVDQDNQYTYSPVVRVALIAQAFDIQVSPNPFTDRLMLTANMSEAGQIELRIFDGMGRLVKQQSFTVSKGSNNLSIQLSSEIASGVYYAEIWKSGKRIKQVKLLKQ